MTDPVTELGAFGRGAPPPADEQVRRARADLLAFIDAAASRRRRRRVRLAAFALAIVVPAGSALAVAETDILRGPPAPPQHDAALRGLFPPERIGRATTLARHAGRTLFGARTESGGYCFSATSPVDPKAEGGHCVSAREAQVLDRGGTVAFAMSGGSVGGYAPGAVRVRISGAGLDVTAPVAGGGWWVAAAPLPEPPLPAGVPQAVVVATGIGAAGETTGRDSIYRIYRANGREGPISIAFE